MNSTTLYIVRHGKTMFNTIHRTQGWSDTPLTKEGEQVIHFLGKGLKHVDFKQAYSSDSGRAIQTANIILQEHPNQKNIPYQTDARIREWCFGSLEGGFDAELWGVISKIVGFDEYQQMINNNVSYQKMAQAIFEADTANWAEPYETIKKRVWDGFLHIAQRCEQSGGGNVLVVSHGLTIAFLLTLIDKHLELQIGLENGSVTKINYKNGAFTIETINDTHFIEEGQNLL